MPKKTMRPERLLPVKQGPGRPSAEIDYREVENCASVWMTHHGAASWLGISLSTFKNRMKDDAGFREAWERGLGRAHNNLRANQWDIVKRRGLNQLGAATSMAIHMTKHMFGETDRSVVEHANKDGKPLEVVVGRPTEFMGVNIATATDAELEAMALLAAARERQAEEAAAAREDDLEGP